VSLHNTVEFWIEVLVVPSQRTIALSVDEPDLAAKSSRLVQPRIKCPFAVLIHTVFMPPGLLIKLWNVTELTFSRSPSVLIVTPCPSAIEFLLVPSQITICRSVELLGTVRVVMLLSPLAFVVFIIVLFDIHNL
jgi:hypothetical protein